MGNKLIGLVSGATGSDGRYAHAAWAGEAESANAPQRRHGQRATVDTMADGRMLLLTKKRWHGDMDQGPELTGRRLGPRSA